MSKKQIPSKPKTTTAAIPTDPNALKKLKISLGLIIVAFAFILYAQSISFNYTMDDYQVLNQNRFVKEGFAGIPSILKTDYLNGAQIKVTKGPIYRPTCLILFAIEWQFFPDNPHFYHFINVLLFTLTCLLLFVLLCKLFEKQNLLFPFICALLFVAHPIHSEVVNNIKSADEILCFVFGILSLIFILKAVSNKFNLYLFLSGIFFFLSSISKETGISFLMIIPLTVFIFTDSSQKRLVIISLVMLVISVLYFFLRVQVLQSIRLNTSDSYMYNSVVAAPDFISRQATVFYILLKYIILLIFPHPLTWDYNFGMIKVQSLSDIPAIIGLLVNLVFGIYAVINLKKKSIISYGILFYLITLSPVSNMFIFNGATMAERFLFIPSLGFCIIICYLITKFTKAETIKNSFGNLAQMVLSNAKFFIFIFILTGLYSIKTFSRSMDWKDDITILSHDVLVSDKSATAHRFLGEVLANKLYPKEKDSTLKTLYIDSAINEYKKSINIFPGIDVIRELAYCYSIKMDYKKAILNYSFIILDNEKYADSTDRNNIALSYYNLGLQYNNERKFDLSLNTFDSALKYKPDFALVYNNKGVAYLNKTMNKEALAAFEESIRLEPKFEKAYMNMGCVYSNTGQYEKAFEYYNTAIKLDSSDYQPYYFMGITYQNMGDKIKAKQYLDKANKIKSEHQN